MKLAPETAVAVAVVEAHAEKKTFPIAGDFDALAQEGAHVGRVRHEHEAHAVGDDEMRRAARSSLIAATRRSMGEDGEDSVWRPPPEAR